MRTKMLGLVIGLLLIGMNGFAADGDLIVNGKVGIGTTSPSLPLDARGSSNVQGHFQSNTGTISGGIELWSADSTSKYELQAVSTASSPAGGFIRLMTSYCEV